MILGAENGDFFNAFENFKKISQTPLTSTPERGIIVMFQKCTRQ